jgi:hypothetical protein
MNRFFVVLICGAVFMIPGTSRAVEAVTNSSPEIVRFEVDKDIAAHREAVKTADAAYQQAVFKYGKKSPEAEEAAKALAKERKALDAALYQSNKVPGSPPVAPTGKPDIQREAPAKNLPAEQIKF